MNEKIIISEIAKLIAFDKKELISNINALGYRLKTNSDKIVSKFIIENTGKDQRLAQMLANMIERQSYAGWGSELGNLITGVFSPKQKAKKEEEIRKQKELELAIEQTKKETAAVSGQSVGLTNSEKIIIYGGGGLLLLITLILFVKNRRLKAQTQILNSQLIAQ